MMKTKAKKIRTALDAGVKAAPWLTDEHAALVMTSRKLADALDAIKPPGLDDYAQLSRLSLEFRQCLRGLGLYVGEEPQQSGEVVTMNVLDKIRAVK